MFFQVRYFNKDIQRTERNEKTEGNFVSLQKQEKYRIDTLKQWSGTLTIRGSYFCGQYFIRQSRCFLRRF